MTLALYFWFLAVASHVSFVQSSNFNHTDEALADLVTSLPGLPNSTLSSNTNSSLDLTLFSGFLEITSNNLLYYSLVESQSDSPSTDPLIIWVNAGPGCSGMVSFLTEFGPFRLISPASGDPSADTHHHLERNPFSWSSLASVLYIEQPIGVGYSHRTDSSGPAPDYGDRLSAVDNLLAVEAFFERFPALEGLDVYLGRRVCLSGSGDV